MFLCFEIFTKLWYRPVTQLHTNNMNIFYELLWSLGGGGDKKNQASLGNKDKLSIRCKLQLFGTLLTIWDSQNYLGPLWPVWDPLDYLDPLDLFRSPGTHLIYMNIIYTLVRTYRVVCSAALCSKKKYEKNINKHKFCLLEGVTSIFWMWWKGDWLTPTKYIFESMLSICQTLNEYY